MREIPLVNSDLKALVDEEYYDNISKFTWRLCKRDRIYYAVRYEHVHINGRRKTITIRMHRKIMGEGHPIYDHKNGNGLDNQKENIRPCTCAQNSRNKNSYKTSRNTSLYKGVRFHQRKYWDAQIGYNNKFIHIGCFDSEIEAAKAYDEKARELFGEFARCNFN